MVDAEEKKRYNVLENVLKDINQKYISFPEEMRKRNNKILLELLDALIPKMKEKNTLFKQLYFTTFFGGSFYDGLRVGAPDEFDLDLLMTLPKMLNIDLNVSNIPGFVHVKITNLLELFNQPHLKERFNGLEKLVDNQHHLDNLKVRQWMERIVTLTINDFPQEKGSHVINIKSGKFLAKFSKAGPAFTLKVNGRVGKDNVVLDIDLVPCFRFAQDKWPKSPFRPNPTPAKSTFFIVPKPQKNGNLVGEHYWRLSFQEQERELIDKKQYLKPSIKFLKKMRDTSNHACIASYYLKTIALWEKEKRPEAFWSSSLSYVFMTLLKSYYESIKNGKILYYWNKNNNLINGPSAATLTNVENRLKAIINDIDKNLTVDPNVVAKYICKYSHNLLFLLCIIPVFYSVLLLRFPVSSFICRSVRQGEGSFPTLTSECRLARIVSAFLSSFFPLLASILKFGSAIWRRPFFLHDHTRSVVSFEFHL
ncbi:cyclic GMP-AMP synthase-like receptor isoform X2 [Diabrotica virgifera virgifera]|uniref:Cyclic GMP-AMP synthase-like n=1 Tax=Diabrotica virgifera virgifera TaxID=50390 RepID=A0ABM5KTF0_DIAVI|nr:cyclic GMP-AMP synthase-like receptor isoform X2 [Diabrotica virgifera virgifera]